MSVDMLIEPSADCREFFDLAERFRGATEPEDVKRLGDQLGRLVFGGLSAPCKLCGPEQSG